MFLSAQLVDAGWDDLSNDDKMAVLNNANAEFNRLQWIGKKVSATQADAFPRILYEEIVETPDVVRYAIAEYCLNYARLMTNETLAELRKGLTSEKVGPISNNYSLEQALKTAKTYNKYLVDWIYRGGGYRG